MNTVRMKKAVFACFALVLPVMGVSCTVDGGGNGGGDVEDGGGNDNGGPPPTVVGACCAGDGTCSMIERSECAGDYQGDDTSCEPNPCPEPMGACCVGAECSTTPENECPGAYQGNGTECGLTACNVSPFTNEAEERGIDLIVIQGRQDQAGSGMAFADSDLFFTQWLVATLMMQNDGDRNVNEEDAIVALP
ncbi:MAG: hypothetical protein AABZ47_04225 [Planctomycetota bacterium]